jgi:DNA invertase Pin-like site-specific DNA recombinase
MSTSRQEDSIAQQQAWADPTARREGVEIVRTFADRGIAGDESLTRPDLLAMIEFCAKEAKAGRPVEVLMCWDLDRFSRANSIVMNAMLAQLIDVGVTRVLTREGWLDLDDEIDRAMMNVKQEFGKAAYVKSVSSGITRAALKRAKEGRWNGGRRPYGYTVAADGKLAVGETRAAEAVRWMFREMADRDTSLLRLAEQLQGEGVPPPVGKSGRWTRDNVRTILRNPIYTGSLYYNRLHFGKYHKITGDDVKACRAVKTAKKKAKALRNADEDVIVVGDTHPALVDRETFDRAQQKLQQRWHRPGKPRRNIDWTLSGLLCCTNCRGPMWGLQAQSTNRHGQHYEWRKYVCRTYMKQGKAGCSFNTVLESKLVKLLAEAIQQHFSDPSFVAELQELMREQQRARIRQADQRGPALRARIAELTKLIEDGAEKLVRLPADVTDEVVARIREWKKQREQLTQELRQLDATTEAQAEEEAKTARALTHLRRLSELICKADARTVRETMQGLIDRVELRFSHEDRGRRRFTEFAGGTIHLNQCLAVFGDVSIGLPMSEK